MINPAGQTISQVGNVAAPGASANIVQILTPPAGIYRVVVLAAVIGATAVAADLVNFQLQVVGPPNFTIGQVFGAMGLLTTSIDPTETVYEMVQLNGAQNLDLNAIIAATAGTTYLAQVTATLVGS